MLQNRRSAGEELDLYGCADPFEGARLEDIEGREANAERLTCTLR